MRDTCHYIVGPAHIFVSKITYTIYIYHYTMLTHRYKCVDMYTTFRHYYYTPNTCIILYCRYY